MPKKRQDGRYEIKVKVSQPGEPRKYKAVYATTLREAQARAKELEAEVAAGLVAGEKKTVRQLCSEWLTARSPEIRQSTMYQYREHLGMIADRIGDQQAKSVTIDTARATIADIAKQSLSVANYCSARIRAVYADGMARGVVTSNPWMAVPKYTYTKRVRRALTDTERKALETANLIPMDRVWVDLLLYTGMRRAESCGIKTSDVDFDGHRIHIVRSVVAGRVQDTKTPAGVRWIPMPRILEETLRAYILHYAKDGDFLLTTTRGTPWSTTTFKNHWAAILKQAFGDNPPNDLTPHVLRHNYASTLVKSKVSPAVAQRLLGHANFSVTLDVYTHFGYSDLDADAIRNIFD